MSKCFRAQSQTDYNSTTTLALASGSRGSGSRTKSASSSRSGPAIFNTRAPAEYASLSLGSQTYRPWASALVPERRKAWRPEKPEHAIAAGAPSVLSHKGNNVVLGSHKRTFETNTATSFTDRSAESRLELRDRGRDLTSQSGSSVMLGRAPNDWKTTFETHFPYERARSARRSAHEPQKRSASARTASFFRRPKGSSFDHTTDSVRFGAHQKSPEKEWSSDFRLGFGANPTPRAAKLFKRKVLRARGTDWGSTYRGAIPAANERQAPSSAWKTTFEASYQDRSKESSVQRVDDREGKIQKGLSNLVLGTESDRPDIEGSTAAMVGLASPRNKSIGRQQPIVQANRSSIAFGCDGLDWSTTMAGALDKSSRALMQRVAKAPGPIEPNRHYSTNVRICGDDRGQKSDYVSALTLAQSASGKNCEAVPSAYRSVNNWRSVSEAGWRQGENADSWNTTFNEGYGTEPHQRPGTREPIRMRMKKKAPGASKNKPRSNASTVNVSISSMCPSDVC